MRLTSRFSISLTLAAGLLSAGLLSACGADVPASRPVPVVGKSSQPADMSAMATDPGTFNFNTVGALSFFDQASGQADLQSAIDFTNAGGMGVTKPAVSKTTIPGTSCPVISVGENVLALAVFTMPDPLVVWADFGNTACDTGGGSGPWVSGTLVTALYGLSNVLSIDANTILTGSLTNTSLSGASLTLAVDFFDLTSFTTDPATPTTGPRVDGGLDVDITVDGSGNPSNGAVRTDSYIRFDTYASGTGSVSNTVIVSNMNVSADVGGALSGGLRYATPDVGFMDVTLTGVKRDTAICDGATAYPGAPTAGIVTFDNGTDTVELNFNGTTAGTCGQADVTVNTVNIGMVTVGTL